MGANAKRRRQEKTLVKMTRKVVGPDAAAVPAWLRMTEEQAAQQHRQIIAAYHQRLADRLTAAGWWLPGTDGPTEKRSLHAR